MPVTYLALITNVYILYSSGTSSSILGRDSNPMTSNDERLAAEIERIKKGGAEKYHERNRQQKKLFARDRLKLLLDDGKIEFEDGMFAECQNPELPADGSITGVGRIHGRPVAFSASDSTVKAGSAGEKSVQKSLRIQEMAMQMRIPMFYLSDSAGAANHYPACLFSRAHA